ncbi:TPA: hypothetical protein ACH3X1_008136 [Trebouxia sp. C0004]
MQIVDEIKDHMQKTVANFGLVPEKISNIPLMKKFNNQKQTVSVWQESVQQRFGFASKGAAAVIDNNAHTATSDAAAAGGNVHPNQAADQSIILIRTIVAGQTAHELVGGSTTAGIQSSDQEHLNDTAKAGAYAKIKSDQVVRPNGYGTEKAGCAPGPDLTKSQQSELLAKMRQPISSSRDESRLKPHEPSLPNAPAKQQRKGSQGKKQPDAVRSKQKPTSKPRGSPTELEEEAEISSTASSDADGDEDPQEMYDSGSGRD